MSEWGNCVVPNCARLNSFGFFTFPKQQEKHDVWLQLCGLKAVQKEDTICADHFMSNDFCLKANAYPSLHLNSETPNDSIMAEIKEENVSLSEEYDFSSKNLDDTMNQKIDEEPENNFFCEDCGKKCNSKKQFLKHKYDHEYEHENDYEHENEHNNDYEHEHEYEHENNYEHKHEHEHEHEHENKHTLAYSSVNFIVDTTYVFRVLKPTRCPQ